MHPLTFQLTPFQTNCYVIQDGGQTLILDPGALDPRLLKASSAGADVRIINTHGHCDHCGGNGPLVERLGCSLMMHPLDLPLLQTIEHQGLMFGLDVSPSPPPDVLLAQGDIITVGSLRFNVLHVPGHTKGHIALAGDGVVFAGDVLFAGSIGRTDLPGGDYDVLLASIRDHLLPLPDDTVVYSGHGPATTIGAERRGNPFLAGL